ncbi:flagellar hook-associated protein FlgK [Mycobacteroides abscessus subsp. abscessus]|nr:flagellar hook-associated protein FlgK [Mycobacteroides abscessus subsp. abscessus]
MAQVGTRASAVSVSKAAQQASYTQASNEELSNSGVNTDEEGASLIRYQQAYAAAGKILAMSSQLFDELITSLR